jgi:hypothetical protein
MSVSDVRTTGITFGRRGESVMKTGERCIVRRFMHRREMQRENSCNGGGNEE